MANNNMNVTPANNGCVSYILPDGTRTVVSWEFVSNKLKEAINPIVDSLTLENKSLDDIIAKLDEWIGEES